MRKPIIIWPDMRLVQSCAPVKLETEEDKKELHQLLEDMRDSLWASKSGVALAAPQIGVTKKVIILMDDPGNPKTGIIEMINPELVYKSKERIISYGEGCLSFPGETVDVSRHASVVALYLDRDGCPQQIDSSLCAHPLVNLEIQHEFDHIFGVTLADHVGSVKRDVMRRRLRKLKEAQEEHQNLVHSGSVPGYAFATR